jgi:hypothetical protein
MLAELDPMVDSTAVTSTAAAFMLSRGISLAIIEAIANLVYRRFCK